MHAECFPANRQLLRGVGWLDAPHASPHPDCQCGVYAYHRPGTQAYYGEWLWTEGVVTAWGRIEAHRDGLRAEHARIEALARPPANEPSGGARSTSSARASGSRSCPAATCRTWPPSTARRCPRRCARRAERDPPAPAGGPACRSPSRAAASGASTKRSSGCAPT
jgi:hypothetical protein